MRDVADGVADLVVDQVLPVGADVALEGRRAAHPSGRVDEHPRFGVRSVNRVEAGRLDLDLVAAALAHRQRRRQRHPEVGLDGRVVDSLEGELRVVGPTLRVAQGLGHHPGESLVAAEGRRVDAVLDLDGVGERLGRAHAHLRGGARHDPPGLVTGLGEWSARGKHAGGQVGIEFGQPARRGADDGRPRRPDRRRTLQLILGHRHRGTGHGLVDHDAGQHDQDGQRVRTPPVGGQKPAQRALHAQLTVLFTVGSGPSGVAGQRIAQRPQRLVAVVAQHRHASTGVRPGIVGHRTRMA